MGYFSYNCQVCGRDLMSRWSSNGTPEWMKEAVVFMPDDIKIAGKYTGFGAVKTGETIWSSFVSRSHEERYLESGTSLILIDGGKLFNKDEANADHGYLSMHMWLDHFIYNPCCYHRKCWEAVGSPEGYRAPSLSSRTQGSGLAARLYGVANIDDPDLTEEDLGPIIGTPSEQEAIVIWATNAIVHFFHTLSAWIAHTKRAEEQRDMWRSFESLIEKIDLLTAEDKKS